MTRDEIIAMTREAGINLTPAQFSGVLEDEVDEFKLEAFAALVAAAEREACAQVCSNKALHCEAEAQRAIDDGEHDEISAIRSAAWLISICAAAIRQRGAA